MKKINKIMLIDDDRACNFLHQLVIEDADCCKEVVVFQNANDALTHLRENKQEKPDILYLDINMPRMNGWEFLEEFKKLPAGNENRVVVIMLSASMNPEDKNRAQEIDVIKDFKNKPLTVELLEEVIGSYFPVGEEN